MAVLPPVPNCIQAAFHFTQDGQQVRNIMHFVSLSGAGPLRETDLGTNLLYWWLTHLRPLVVDDVRLNQIVMRYLGDQSNPGTIVRPTTTHEGQKIQDPMPNSVTLAMSLHTGLRGRSYRGRIYHIGMSEDVVSGNMATTAHATALVAAYKQLLNWAHSGTPDPVRLAVVSYYHNKAVRPVGVATPVIDITTDGYIDNQRRRLPGRGR